MMRTPKKWRENWQVRHSVIRCNTLQRNYSRVRFILNVLCKLAVALILEDFVVEQLTT